MKSLLKGAKSSLEVAGSAERSPSVTHLPQEEAQCCAKVSKTVAGCHD